MKLSELKVIIDAAQEYAGRRDPEVEFYAEDTLLYLFEASQEGDTVDTSSLVFSFTSCLNSVSPIIQ